MVGYGVQQLGAAEGSTGNGARVFGTEVRGFTEEHKGSIAQVGPRRPRHRRPETEKGAAGHVVAGSDIRPHVVHTVSRAEAAPANMSPLEKAEGDLYEGGRVGIPGQPGRDGEQSPGVGPVQ